MDYELKIQEKTTSDNRFDVRFGYKNAPLNVQTIAFTGEGLAVPSPAVKGYLFRVLGDSIRDYSRTDMDVVTIQDGRIFLVKNHLISDLYGGIENIVAAHAKGDPFFIDIAKKDAGFKQLMATLEFYVSKGLGYMIDAGTKTLKTNEFNKGISQFIFGDDHLRINAVDYGNMIHNKFNRYEITAYFDEKETVVNCKAPTLNKLRVGGPGLDFSIGGNGRLLDNDLGAFGVSLTSAGGGALKFPYTIKELQSAKDTTKAVMDGKEANQNLGPVKRFFDKLSGLSEN